jgi:hypothetical protein
MSRQITHGSTDVSSVIRIVDSSDGTPETGVTSATSGLALFYRREGAVRVTVGVISDLATAAAAHTDAGLAHIGDGLYRVDPPDAAWASGAAGVLIEGTVTGMVVIPAYHPLISGSVTHGTGPYVVNHSGGLGSGGTACTLDTAAGTSYTTWPTDGLRYFQSDGITGAANLRVRFYEKTAYDLSTGAGHQATTTTAATGRWDAAVNLASGDYYVLADNPTDGYTLHTATIRVP